MREEALELSLMGSDICHMTDMWLHGNPRTFGDGRPEIALQCAIRIVEKFGMYAEFVTEAAVNFSCGRSDFAEKWLNGDFNTLDKMYVDGLLLWLQQRAEDYV